MAFLSFDEPERIVELITRYPEFQAMYQDIYEMCMNTERTMEMYSKELQELDRNTVRYMIDELQEDLEQMQAKKECLEAEHKQMQIKNEQMQAENAQMQIKNEQMQAENEQMHEENAMIKEESCQKDEEIRRLKKRLAEAGITDV